MSRTNEVVIGTCEGVLKAWAVKRRPEDERWDIKMIDGVKGTPEEPVPGKGRRRVPIRIRLEVREDVEVDEIGTGEEAPRRTNIKKKFYERYGYTDGCEGCNRLRAGLTQRGHDEGCRSRMEKEMEKDEDGQRLLKGARS